MFQLLKPFNFRRSRGPTTGGAGYDFEGLTWMPPMPAPSSASCEPMTPQSASTLRWPQPIRSSGVSAEGGPS